MNYTDDELIEIEWAACRKKFSYFVEKAFKIVTPGTEYLHNWHIDLMSEYMEAARARDIKRLIINMPPRSLKSICVSVAFPAWCLGEDPTMRFMAASYAEKLSFDLSMDCRRVMTEDWYQKCYPKTRIAEDQNEKSKFSTTEQGYRIATSVGGRSTGFGANCFPAGTKVVTSRGSIPIERIAKNPEKYKVLSCDLSKKRLRYRKVVASNISEAADFMRIFDSFNNVMTCTPEHRVFTVNRGYIEARDLHMSDELILPGSGRSMVVGMQKLTLELQPVYDIQVEEDHNFFANGILVHNCLIIDDCHTPDEAMSDTIREGHLRWFDQTWSSRLNNKKEDIMIIVMQRLHRSDLAGHVLKQGGWTHLNMPAMFDARKTYSIGNFKRVVEKGDLLHPDRLDKKFLEQQRRTSAYLYAAQYMQNPVPDGGGIVKYDWFELWPSDKPLPRFHFVMQVWDTAFTEKTSGDPSGCLTLGVFFPEETDHTSLRESKSFAVMVIDCFCDHLGFPALRSKMIEMRSYRYGTQEKAVDLILVEEKASGQSIIQELDRAGLPVRGFKPGRMDKTARLHSVSHFVESGKVFVPESQKNPGHARSWALDFIDQVCAFPSAEHDEYVDCLSSGLITLSDMTFLRLEEVAEDVDEDAHLDPYAHVHRVNPYGC